MKADQRSRDWEQAMISQVKAAGIDLSQHLSDLEVLARLRHHGAATRLIDVSADPVTALWFTCSEEEDKDGLLLGLDRGAFPHVQEPWRVTYEDALGPAGRGFRRLQFAVGPMDARIAAQRGSFVFTTRMNYAGYSEINIEIPAAWSPEKLAKVCDGRAWSASRGRPVELFPTVVGIRIPSFVKPFLLRVIEQSFGVQRSSVFPDFDGFGRKFA